MNGVWAVCEWHNCHGDGVSEFDGQPVVSLHTTEELAKAARDARNYGYVTKLEVQS